MRSKLITLQLFRSETADIPLRYLESFSQGVDCDLGEIVDEWRKYEMYSL